MSCGRSGPSMDNRSRRVLGRSYAARKMAFPWGGVNSEIDPTRLARAINLEARPRDGECSCDCFDAQLHGDNCKHSLLVRLLGGDEEVVRALREIVPKPKMRYLGVNPKSGEAENDARPVSCHYHDHTGDEDRLARGYDGSGRRAKRMGGDSQYHCTCSQRDKGTKIVGLRIVGLETWPRQPLARTESFGYRSGR